MNDFFDMATKEWSDACKSFDNHILLFACESLYKAVYYTMQFIADKEDFDIGNSSSIEVLFDNAKGKINLYVDGYIYDHFEMFSWWHSKYKEGENCSSALAEGQFCPGDRTVQLSLIEVQEYIERVREIYFGWRKNTSITPGSQREPLCRNAAPNVPQRGTLPGSEATGAGLGCNPNK